ncbi:MAG: hypothetical protein ABIL58_08855 [Pseudomonadota bacterium]
MNNHINNIDGMVIAMRSMNPSEKVLNILSNGNTTQRTNEILYDRKSGYMNILDLVRNERNPNIIVNTGIIKNALCKFEIIFSPFNAVIVFETAH